MNLVYLYGPPGVGKFTVGKELAKITGYKLFHNQLSIEPVISVFDFGTESFNKLVLDLRNQVIEEAAKRNVSMIFTSAYAKGYNEKIMKEIIRRVKKNGGKVLFVQLYCDPKTLSKRISGKSRTGFHKIKDRYYRFNAELVVK